MNTWPLQSRMKEYYGDPVGPNGHADAFWESKNLVYIIPPFKMTYAEHPIGRLRIHLRCAGSLEAILHTVWEKSGKDQTVIDDAGLSVFGGSYNFRLMRGSNTLSVHAFGAAIDLDPARNGFHDQQPHFLKHLWAVEAFEAEGWAWGGRWHGRACDGMHFQAARVG